MKNKILYFTFNDPPNGVYKSQVIEVVDFLNTLDDSVSVKLLAIISPRRYFANRKQIKALNGKALILPSIAPLKYWRMNILLVFIYRILTNTSKIICRGPFATCLALDTNRKAKIVYDGRGAVTAEHHEYGVFDNTGLENKLAAIENKAILESDYHIAVTQKLVKYWQTEYGYHGKKHVIIPCTVSDTQSRSGTIPQEISDFVKNNVNNTLFTFIGGNSKWQGIDLMLEFLTNELSKNENTAAVLLCPSNDQLTAFKNNFKERVLLTTVKPELVHPVISLCDYGLLFRHSTITNQVASPVKVAEYLKAGLKIIISPNIGDYSEFIENTNIGCVLSNNNNYTKRTSKEKERSTAVAKEYFSKSSKTITELYKQVIN